MKQMILKLQKGKTFWMFVVLRNNWTDIHLNYRRQAKSCMQPHGLEQCLFPQPLIVQDFNTLE